MSVQEARKSLAYQRSRNDISDKRFVIELAERDLEIELYKEKYEHAPEHIRKEMDQKKQKEWDEEHKKSMAEKKEADEAYAKKEREERIKYLNSLSPKEREDLFAWQERNAKQAKFYHDIALYGPGGKPAPMLDPYRFGRSQNYGSEFY